MKLVKMKKEVIYNCLSNVLGKDICKVKRTFSVNITYNNKLKGATGRLTVFKYKSKRIINIEISNVLKECDENILKGLIYLLLSKAFNKKFHSFEIELYNLFIKNIDETKINKEYDNKLKRIFDKLNKKYFNNTLECPSLKFGRKSFITLGKYDFSTDTIIISSVLRNAPDELIEFVMYHEMLHKKLKFNVKNKIRFHTKKFYEYEKKFENYEKIQEKLRDFLRKVS